MNKIRIIIAEDHQTVRDGIKFLINAEPDLEVIGEAGDGREAIRMAEKLSPDILLMDISMPKLNGLKATAKLKRIQPDIKILALTRHTEEAYLHELLQAGVSGYVLKQSASAELLRAIRVVAVGGNHIDPLIAKMVLNNYTVKSTKLRGDVSGIPLTNRESEILRQIGWGYSNQEIAEQLELSVKTIEAHKANALKKLNIKSRLDIVQYAILQGWLEED